MNVKPKVFFSVILSLLWLALSIRAAAAPQVKTYLVNSDTDAADAIPGDGVCATGGGNCTLHAAIQEANLDHTPSTIKFASTFQGIHNISDCSLPVLTEDNTTIDASDRWDIAYHRPGVEINGLSCTLITIQSSGNSIKGLFFGGSSSIGVKITQGSNNTIGGSETGQRNVFYVGKWGVRIEGNSPNNSVVYNYIGTIDGETLPGSGGFFGEVGVFVFGGPQSSATISNNVIGGQSDSGILLWAGGNVVSDNIIGLSWNKAKALPNNMGIHLEGDNNVVGDNNVIGGNTSHGIYLHHALNSQILNNYIGYGWSSNGGNGGDGILNYVSDNNVIGKAQNGNSFSGNSGNGIRSYHSNGLSIQANSIVNSGADGIHFEVSSGTIGGSNPNDINSIGGSQGDGIHLNGSANVTVLGNYIGFDSGAFDAGNHGHGILIDNGSSGNTIGGENPGEGNWIGWNLKDGVRISGSTTHDNFVLGNLVGIPINWGWEAPNGNHGISIYDGAHDNHVGGLSGGNTVMASGWSGVVIVNSSSNAVIANRIGTDNASTHWGNTYFGVNVVGSASANFITFNEIAYSGTHGGTDNAEAGVKIDAAVDNLISQNSIHDNDGPGIQLVNGGNANITAPTITSASCSGQVQGQTVANRTIEIFSDKGNEGRIYEGTVTADATGHWIWNGSPNGPNLTATARAPSNNNTSPFSPVFTIGSCNSAPTASFTVTPSSGLPGTNFSFDASSSSDNEDPLSALQVRWDWQNDGVYDTTWSTNKSASHKFSLSGVHTVRLQVRDTAGLTGQATRQVVITGQINKHIYLPVVGKDMP